MATTEERIAALERLTSGQQKQISAMSKILKENGLVAAVADGACSMGLDPETCELASTHRYQKGCRGESCKTKNREYYSANRARAKGEETPVAKPARRTAAKTKSSPVTKPAKKLGAKKVMTRG